MPALEPERGAPRRLLCVFGAGLAVAGCLPGRDNPHDSSLRPSAVLHVRDATDPGFSCLEDPDLDALDTVAATSRRACLVLDARASADPQGDDLWFDYEALDPDGNVLVTFATGTSSRAVRVAPAVLRTLPLGVVRFQVTARDPIGAQSSRIAPVALVNAPPQALANPERTLPIGGYPWAPSETCVEMEWDASASTDFDDDDLAFTWTFPPEPGCDEVTAVAGRIVGHGVDLTVPGRRIVELVADDGEETSQPARGELIVGTQGLWRNGLGGERFDPVGILGIAPPGIHSHVAFAGVDGPRIVASWREAGIGVIAMDQGDGQIDSIPAGPSDVVPHVAGRTGTDVFWVVRAVSPYTTTTVSRFEPALDSLGTEVDVPLDFPLQPGQRVAMDSVEGLWLANPSPPGTVARVDGTVQVYPPEPSHFVAALDALDDAWAVFLPEPLSGVSSFLRHYTGATWTDHPLPDNGGVATIRMLAGDEAWLALAGSGLLRIDLGILAGGGTLEQATVQAEPDLCCTMAPTDDRTGDVWVRDGGSATRVSVLGDRLQVPALGSLELFGVDARGMLFFSYLASEDLYVAPTPSPSGVSWTTTAPGFRTDLRWGGMWMAMGGSVTLRGSDGRPVREIERVLLDGNEVSLGFGTFGVPSQDARWLWATPGDGPVYAFDLQQPIPSGHLVRDTGLSGIALIPYPAGVADSSGSWLIASNTSVFAVGTGAGSTLTEYPVPETGDYVRASAASPASGDLCLVAERTGANTEVFIHRVPLDGPPLLLASVPLPSSSFTNRSFAVSFWSPSPASDVCLASMSYRDPVDPALDTWEVRGWDSTGAQTFGAAGTGNGVITSVRGTGPDRAWVTLDRRIPGDPVSHTTTALVGSAGTMLLELPADSGARFLLR